ncbi:MAG: hypothetical protein DWQ21_02245 [Bacteroidetes bacterium]|nr:MAG: hypothetical protein DWQ21_02245 [Bacteroidota bacterium]REK57337.1 MAG: hypothetical protein DWQ49_09205 [Bacteroidota bacterium]
MKLNWNTLLMLIAITAGLSSCRSNRNPKLMVKLVVDDTQDRLGNNGLPAALPFGNAGQNPMFNSISAHYLELAPTPYTQLGEGEILYHAPETTKGGDNAIDFRRAEIAAPGELWLEIPLSRLNAGTYEWVRLSLSYQNYDVVFHYNNEPYTASLASFVGFNQYIKDFEIDGETVEVNENKKQGFWAFKSIGGLQTGQTPEGGTTVPNPLATTSPIPAGSCVVTGNFNTPLVINGDETEDLTITMSLSTNKSFEWVDKNGNGKWDVDQGADENVVDMGLRGLQPSYDWQ